MDDEMLTHTDDEHADTREKDTNILSADAVFGSGRDLVTVLPPSAGGTDDGNFGSGRDSVTGLPGIESLRKAVKGAYGDDSTSYPGGPALVAFDIENFKSFNMRYGFEGGDMLLRLVAKLLVEEFPGRTIVRMSEDHFFAVAGLAGIEQKALRANVRVKEYQRDVNIELKTGIYPLTNSQESTSAACDAARFACNSVKRHPDSVYRIFDAQLREQVSTRRYAVDNLDRALSEGWIKVYYQPIVRVQSGQVCGVEALARWDDPMHGLLSPVSFISILEDYHLIHKLDIHILRLACVDFRRVQDAGYPVLPFSVNLSRLDFELCDVNRAVEDVTRNFGVPVEMVKIEVTESVLGSNAELLRDKLARFRRKGFEVWMDDFGSGYSSLNLLKDYTFDVLKIDMLFLRGYGLTKRRSIATRIVIASIVGMAKELGIQTLAEGVESEEQLEFLRNIGCEKAQGFLYSRPLPCDQLVSVLKEKDITCEVGSESAYYDALGRVNLLGSQIWSVATNTRRRPGELKVMTRSSPLAIIEVVDGKEINVLGSNKAYRDFSAEIGFNEVIVGKTTDINADTLRARLLAAFIMAARQRTEQSMDFTLDGRFCNLHMRFIAECTGRMAFLVSGINLSVFNSVGTTNDLEAALWSLCEVFTRIDLVALDNSFARTLYSASARYLPFLVAYDAKLTIESYARRNIHPGDQRRYKDFCDLSTLTDRFQEKASNYLSNIFRTIDVDGSYTYQSYTLVPHSVEGIDCVLVFVRDAFYISDDDIVLSGQASK